MKFISNLHKKIESFSSRKQNFIYVFLIVLFGIIIYSNSFNNEFVWDDEDNIYNNAYIQDWKYLPNYFTENVVAGARKVSNYYRPMVLLTYSVDYKIWKLNVFGYHLSSFLFHIISAILLYYLVLLLLNKKPVAFLTSLFFTIHPIQPEAVAYMAGRADPQATMLIMASAVLFFSLRKYKNIYLKSSFYFLSLIFFVVALFSKESMALFPGILVFIDFCFFEKKLNFKPIKRMILRVVPFLAIVVGYVMLRLTTLNFSNTLNFYNHQNIYSSNLGIRLLTLFKVLPEYFRILIWPTDLHMERSTPLVTSIFDPSFFVFIVFALVIIYIIKSTWNNTKLYFFGFGWFFIWLLPYSNIFPINAIYMDHWLYMPSIGFFLMISNLYDKFKWKKEYLTYLLIFFVVFFSLGAIKRNNDWQNPITLYSNILEYSPETARVHNNLAMEYFDQGMVNDAVAHYKLSISMSDLYPQSHYNLGNAYVSLGLIDEAVEEYKKAVEMDDNFVQPHKQLAAIYYSKEMYDEYQEEMKKVNEILR